MHAEALAISRNFLTLEDVALLKHIGVNLPRTKDGVVVADLGAGSGTTALSIFESNESAVVWTFDTSPDAIDWTMKAVDNCGFSRRWHSWVSDAAEGAAKIPHKVVSAVLLDASHLYEETRAELKAWVPKVVKGGWLWCHDYEGDGGIEHNGVRQAVDEFLVSHTNRIAEQIFQGLGVAVKFK